jgi:hypothetical protein
VMGFQKRMPLMNPPQLTRRPGYRNANHSNGDEQRSQRKSRGSHGLIIAIAVGNGSRVVLRKFEGQPAAA